MALYKALIAQATSLDSQDVRSMVVTIKYKEGSSIPRVVLVNVEVAHEL